jgi:PIN domain nuclease of toxin-antitoxin system
LSIASLWEISIKVSIGKLELGLKFTDLIEREIKGNAIKLLEISPEYLDELAKLPVHHKDPFDRLIIVQSIVEDMCLISKDNAFENYPVTILW